MADVLSGRQTADRSTAELVQHTAEQVTKLVRDELALARAELTQKGKHAGIGVGLFGGGGLLAFFGGATLVVAVVLLLALAMPAWVAALVVAIVLFVIAGVFAMMGRKQVKQAKPPVPTKSVDSVRADVSTVKSAAKSRGRS
ncbi:MAG TPA: phage holin family protein [Micromonosporaceae bacterium]|nr:phage holin family protein [Micromonosporaceae bacterium]